MCGITGAVNWGDNETLSRMTDIQAHRGPDDRGTWEARMPNGGWVGLGSRRLAILDTSPAGHMPMSTQDGNLVIVYNGEVYNYPLLRRELETKGYQFRSKSDTEAVLYMYQEYGPDCVRYFNGMFAIAIWDKKQQHLFLARDHFGIKPLYYCHQGKSFAFASEIKALLELPNIPRNINLSALHQYLTFLWVPDPLTMFEGIYKLPAGHYAVYKDGQLQITQYWDLTFPHKDHPFTKPQEELIEEVRTRFAQSVRNQLLSDVPLGAFLSAGMDSSSIVSMMSQATDEPVRTYTITFPPKYRVGETTLDDPRVASRVAQKFGCNHHEIVVEPNVTQLLPKLIWHMDEPVADPAIITAYLVCREARNTVTVLLSGIGGDELFAGYRKHYAYYWSKAYKEIPSLLRQGLIEPLVLGLSSLRGTPFKGLVRLTKKMVRSGSLTPQESFLMNCTYLDETQKAYLYSPDLRAKLNGMDPWQQHRDYFNHVTHADFLNQMLYLDTKAFMVSLNLTYNDKMSMASSVEVRVPFLDRELAEFVAQHIPPRLKLNGFWHPTTKYIFRKAMQSVLPKEVLHQPKAGFGAPIDYWLAYDLRELVDDLLSEDRIHKRGFFKPANVHQLIEEHYTGREDWSLQIWALLTFELWYQIFIERNL